jgi:hypothetical protein
MHIWSEITRLEDILIIYRELLEGIYMPGEVFNIALDTLEASVIGIYRVSFLL